MSCQALNMQRVAAANECLCLASKSRFGRYTRERFLTECCLIRSLHTGGAPSKERHDPRFDSITKLMSTIFNMCAVCSI